MKINCKIPVTLILMAVFAVAIITLKTTACQAAQWEWIASTDKVTYEIDASDVKYVDYRFAGRNIVCWIKDTELDKSFSICQMAFRVKNGTKQFVILSGVQYDQNGHSVFNGTNVTEPLDYNYNNIPPDSVAEQWYIAARRYVK